MDLLYLSLSAEIQTIVLVHMYVLVFPHIEVCRSDLKIN